MHILQAMLADAEQVTDAFLTAMPDELSWPYRFPYRFDYPDDHRKFNCDLTRRFISPEYSDFTVMVVDQNDTPTSPNKIVSFSVWDMSYINKRRYGPEYEPKSPPADVSKNGGSQRKDANPKHIAAFRKALTEVKEKYFDIYEPEITFLQILGTVPEHRRRGYGGSLVKWGIERATSEKVRLSLDAGPQGAHLYRSLGFRDLGKQRMQASDEEEYLESIAMLYEPPTVEPRARCEKC